MSKVCALILRIWLPAVIFAFITGQMGHTFILNDQNKVNSYGFRIANQGLDLERFKANPVMLSEHVNSLWNVIGKWTNLRIQGDLLLADAEFDLEDQEAKEIAGKVKRGFIKACSLGIIFLKENMQRAADGIWDLMKSEALEASIVAVPSNGNALKLYAAPGQLLEDSEVKLSISELTEDFTTKDNKTQNQKKMEKIILSATALVALGLAVAPENASDLSVAVESLAAKLNKTNADLAAEKTAKEILQIQLAAQKESQAKIMLSEAKLSGKITAEEETEMLKDAIANPEGTAKLLAKIPAKVSLSGKVSNSDSGEGKVKTMDDFEKLSDKAKLAFKADNPEEYKALFK